MFSRYAAAGLPGLEVDLVPGPLVMVTSWAAPARVNKKTTDSILRFTRLTVFKLVPSAGR